jgi:hypothetical protein
MVPCSHHCTASSQEILRSYAYQSSNCITTCAAGSSGKYLSLYYERVRMDEESMSPEQAVQDCTNATLESKTDTTPDKGKITTIHPARIGNVDTGPQCEGRRSLANSSSVLHMRKGQRIAGCTSPFKKPFVCNARARATNSEPAPAPLKNRANKTRPAPF